MPFPSFLTWFHCTPPRRGRSPYWAPTVSQTGLLSAIFLLLMSHLACAQQIKFRQYVQQDGLSNLSVTSLLQDREGYIWVGTENGLFRHDRTEFERIGDAEGLRDTVINSLLEDSSGRSWVGTARDLYLREGRRFRPIRPDGRELNVRYGLRVATLAPDRLLLIDKEELLELWASSGSDVWHSRTYFTAEQIRSLPALAHVNSLYTDGRGRIWLGCGEAICRAPDAFPQRPFLPMERLQQAIAEAPFSYESARLRVTASFGIAWLQSASDTAEALLGRADQALYRAKDAGRDRVEYAA